MARKSLELHLPAAKRWHLRTTIVADMHNEPPPSQKSKTNASREQPQYRYEVFFYIEVHNGGSGPFSPTGGWALPLADESSLYLYSTRTKKLLHQCRLMQGLVYWTWVSASTLGLVTRQAVFHWDLSSGGCP